MTRGLLLSAFLFVEEEYLATKPPPPALRALPPAVGLDQKWTMADGDNWVFDSLVNFLRGPIWNVPILTLIENKSLGRLSQL